MGKQTIVFTAVCQGWVWTWLAAAAAGTAARTADLTTEVWVIAESQADFKAMACC